MKDVADAAGVSFKTVSRVVNGEPSVSEPLTERVNAAIAELGYHPHQAARNLRRSVSQTIGFIHSDISNPFFSAIHRGLEDVAIPRGYLIVSGSSDEDPDRFDALVKAFVSRRVGGLVVVPTGVSRVLDLEIRHNTPMVFVDREPGRPGDLVLSDHRGGARMATRHLIEAGHTRIAFLGDRRILFSAAERLFGYHDALAGAGLTTEWVVTDIEDPRKSEATTRALMQTPPEKRPTALFTAQNYITAGAVKALHAMNLQRSVALVGFDDIDMGDVINPGISVVPQDAKELGRRAGDLLFRRIDGEVGEPVRETLSLRLIARGSGEIRVEQATGTAHITREALEPSRGVSDEA